MTDEQTTMAVLEAMSAAIPRFKSLSATQKSQALENLAFTKALLEVTETNNLAEARVEMRRLMKFKESHDCN
jgi:hypothetical protein